MLDWAQTNRDFFSVGISYCFKVSLVFGDSKFIIIFRQPKNKARKKEDFLREKVPLSGFFNFSNNDQRNSRNKVASSRRSLQHPLFK